MPLCVQLALFFDLLPPTVSTIATLNFLLFMLLPVSLFKNSQTRTFFQSDECDSSNLNYFLFVPARNHKSSGSPPGEKPFRTSYTRKFCHIQLSPDFASIMGT
eukprot:scaffold14624_cov100-Cylindrotheca_fusiformis.AAC.2